MLCFVIITSVLFNFFMYLDLISVTVFLEGNRLSVSSFRKTNR